MIPPHENQVTLVGIQRIPTKLDTSRLRIPFQKQDSFKQFSRLERAVVFLLLKNDNCTHYFNRLGYNTLLELFDKLDLKIENTNEDEVNSAILQLLESHNSTLRVPLVQAKLDEIVKEILGVLRNFGWFGQVDLEGAREQDTCSRLDLFLDAKKEDGSYRREQLRQRVHGRFLLMVPAFYSSFNDYLCSFFYSIT